MRLPRARVDEAASYESQRLLHALRPHLEHGAFGRRARRSRYRVFRVSLSYAVQVRFYELLAAKRLSVAERASIKERYMRASSDGAVRRLIRELQFYADMEPDEDEWQLNIENEFDEIFHLLEARHMAIIASAQGKGTIPPHPEGQFPGVCIDVIDRGLVESSYLGVKKMKHKVTIRFWCGEYGERADGESIPLFVDEWFVLSLHEKSALRPFLESWRGKKFTDAELKAFDLETLIGVPAFLQVSQNTVGEKVYANTDSVMKLPKGVPGIPPLADYVRVCDRPERDAPSGNSSEYEQKVRALANASVSHDEDDNEPPLPF